jgi:AcrR family transcriptional regulator
MLAMIPDTQRPIVRKRLQMPGESVDVRAIRARDQIGLALVSLAGEKRYDDITVQDIAHRAQVSRTTFYAHFQDRDDIMLRYSIVFGEYLGRQLRWNHTAAQYRFPVAPLFAHMHDIRLLYEALSRARRTDALLKVFQINLATWFEKRIESRRAKAAASGASATCTDVTKVPAQLLAQHFAVTIVQLLAWWMEHHCPSEPETIDEHFHRLVAGLR